MNKTWKIYVHRNLTNGKLYIGQTCEDNVKRRWHGGANYRKCPYFYNAIQKYGWDGFDHFVIIDDIKTQEEANVLEEFLIAKYDTTNREKGYNLQSGGDVKKQSPETCLKISQHHIEAHQHRPEVQAVKQQFEAIPNKEELKVPQNTTKGRKRNTYQYICIETQKVYSSSCKAERDTGIPAHGIRDVCRGAQKSVHGTHWAYYEEGKEYKLEDYINITSKSTKAKKVYCMELDIVFNSGSEAASYIGQPHASHIFDCCNGIRETCGGYHWRYKEVLG